jgi:hypothetical protein
VASPILVRQHFFYLYREQSQIKNLGYRQLFKLSETKSMLREDKPTKTQNKNQGTALAAIGKMVPATDFLYIGRIRSAFTKAQRLGEISYPFGEMSGLDSQIRRITCNYPVERKREYHQLP